MIHLGYELGTGAPVSVPLAHTAVTGQTQASGKTTTLEALIHRSGRRAIAFLTKRGEGTFQTMKVVPPYFSESVDWLMVKELLEAQAKTKLKFETSWIIEVSKGARNLADVKRNCEIALRGVRADRDDDGEKVKWTRKPASGLSQGVYTVLDAYLEKLLPQIESMNYTKTLALQPGLNVMDLTAYSLEMQGLVVRSVLEWVYEREKRVIVVIPEAWELLPQDRGSPVRLAAETFIRKGAVLENYLYLDSQDLAGVNKAILRQVGVWILGVQREANEVMRTLKQFISKPARPRPDDLMSLGKGQFFVAYGTTQRKVYVQPHWMESGIHAAAIAMGEETAESATGIYRDYVKQFRRRESEVPPPASAETGGAEGKAGPAPSATHDQPDITPGWSKSRFAETFPRKDETNIPTMEAFVARQTVLLPGAAIEQQGQAMTKRGNTMPPETAAASGTLEKGQAELLYDYVRTRLLTDERVLAVLRQQPEIRIIEQPKVLEVDGETLTGQVATLIDEGFFAQPRKGYAVFQELVERRRKRFSKPSVYETVNEVARMGFLTRDGEGQYTVVPGMRVTRRKTA